MKPIDLETKRFQHYFKTVDVFQDRLLSAQTGEYQLDMLRLEKWLHTHSSYDMYADGSIQDAILKDYGLAAVNFIRELIKLPPTTEEEIKAEEEAAD
jgi:hypothetical protein